MRERDGVVELTPDEGRALFEQECRSRLGISGRLFVALYEEGLLHPCDPDVAPVALILPLVRGGGRHGAGANGRA